MAALLALLSAMAYGSSDFAAGLASRRLTAPPVTGLTELCGLLTALVGVALFGGVGPRPGALAWGALSGIGTGLGTLSLYHGLAIGRMSVVAPTSAVLTAVIPVLAGLALGDTLSVTAAVGIVLAVPAIGLVCAHPGAREHAGARGAVLYGALAGLGFSLLFIALDRAGTRSGAWPLVPGQGVSLLVSAPFVIRGSRRAPRITASSGLLIVGAGALSGAANLLFLAATGHGELAIVAVLSALYPAATVLLARALLAEHWTRAQAFGLLAAAVAIALVSA